MRRALVLLALVSLVGCSQEDLLQKYSSPEAQATARAYIDQLRSRQFEEIERALDPTIRAPNIREMLVTMADQIPSQDPSSVKLVGAHMFSGPDAKKTNTTFEYGFGGRWLLANVAVQEKNGIRTIVGFNINPMTQSLEEQNRFTLMGKSVAHYAVLSAAIAALIGTVYALVTCIRTKALKRKWLWVLFILVGIGKVAVNWSTGEWALAPLSIQLFSASAAAPLYGPWVVGVSLPLGALIFLLYKRPRLKAVERMDA